MDLFVMERYWADEGQADEGHLDPEMVAKELKEKMKAKHQADLSSEQDKSQALDIKGSDSTTISMKKRKKKAKKRKEADGNVDLEESSFTILGEHAAKKKAKVQRVLPQWLANPDIVSVDFHEDQLAVHDLPGLHPTLVEKLRQNGISHFFPVQRQVIPFLLPSDDASFFRPNDVCVSAPTGSGKTLAFVVPVVQALQDRVVPRIRALVVLPVQDLAMQVYKVFSKFCEGTGLRVKVLTASKPFAKEQEELVRQGVVGPHSLCDILVATPGRLVDHIQQTDGFTLSHLRYLIIDEADRVLEDVQNDWLSYVEAAVFQDEHRPRPGQLNVANMSKLRSDIIDCPLQKLLFSATLSQNPEQLHLLNLNEPKLFSSVVKPKDILQQTVDVNIELYTTPAELTQMYTICCDPLKKPQILSYLIRQKAMRKALVFTKSVERTHFLAVLLQACGHSVAELSSQISNRRSRVLSKFNMSETDVLVCTDALARGIDIGQIDFVVSYDCPKFFKTYIHRVGRTARAGMEGCAITIVESRQQRSFYAMMREAKNEDRIAKFMVNDEDLQPSHVSFQEAYSRASETLENEKSLNAEKRKQKRKVQQPSSRSQRRQDTKKELVV